MAKTTAQIQARIDQLTALLDKAHRQLAQSQYIDLIDNGARVDLVVTKGEVTTEHTNVLVLGRREAEGTSGAWFKVRINEGTIDEDVISVRLSAITKLYGHDGEVPEEVEEEEGDEPSAEDEDQV